MSHLLFGTDGIRALTGKAPLSIDQLPKLGYAIAQWIAEKNHAAPSILLAHDTRASSHFIKAALKSGLLLHQSKVFDALALPTPTACFLTRMNKSFNCGIIITASHNPSEYNGIKIVDAQGSKINSNDEKKITELFNKINLTSIDHMHLGNDFRALNPGEPYLHALYNHFDKTFLKGKSIVLDCANGSTSSLCPHIFRMFGATVITINAKPDGVNINSDCGSLFPKKLQETVLSYKADAGFAFDGDGDRVIACNNKGHIKDGDDMLAILMDNPNYKSASAIVGTTFSNEGLAAYTLAKGKKFIRTDVGDKNVIEEMKLHELPLGGEPSGHIIIKDYLDSSDGIFTALNLLDTIKKNENWTMDSFTHYPQVLINIPITQKKDLSCKPITEILTRSKEEFPLGRFVIRYSGTEPLLRILVETPDKKEAELLSTKLANQLRIAIEKA
jgi:phosphoglucosamine mutase